VLGHAAGGGVRERMRERVPGLTRLGVHLEASAGTPVHTMTVAMEVFEQACGLRNGLAPIRSLALANATCR
jgi:hypothetical protein